ncbi:MAG: PfkB domain protein [Ilumatobacteraceae bacterium]|nr:PfkB domain protein [Ilumatobacteraceae bacterium]
MSTYVAIGSICWDEVAGERRLGGSVLFSGLVALAAGWDVRVITAGTAELEAAAQASLPGVEVIVQPSEHDTVMAFPADAELGPKAVPTVADPIDIAAAATHLAAATVVHLAPIMGEVTPELVAAVASAPFIGLTPQGLLRTRRPGTHELDLLEQPGTWWADSTSAVVLSEAEYARMPGLRAGSRSALAVTRGDRGCHGWCDGEEVDLPGIDVGPVAPTGTIGAGDVFASALFLALAQGLPFAEAMDRANRRAAAHVATRP